MLAVPVPAGGRLPVFVEGVGGVLTASGERTAVCFVDAAWIGPVGTPATVPGFSSANAL